MGTRHTPAPWRLADCDPPCIYTADGDLLADFYSHGKRPAQEAPNAARAVACVNACEGIEDPAATLAEVRELVAWAYDALVEERGYNDPSTDRLDALLAKLGRR